MKPIYKAALLVLLCFTGKAQFNLLWAKTMPGYNAIDHTVAVDAGGNVYTAGYFTGPIDLDPGPGTYTADAHIFSDVFITKLDASGNFLWAKVIQGVYAEDIRAMTLDASGNIYATGLFMGTVDFDPGAGVFNLSSLTAETFLVKLDPSGAFIQALRIGRCINNNNNHMDVRSIVVEQAGNILMTGAFLGTVDFDPGAQVFNMTSTTEDIFITKLDVTGTFAWAKSMGAANADSGYGIAADVQGNIYTVGAFASTVDFDPGPGIFNLTSAGGFDGYISKLDVSGNFVWAKSIGGTTVDVVTAVTLDAAGNIFLNGSFSGTVDLDPGIGISNQTSAGMFDVFISKLDANGDFIWTKIMGDTGSDYSFSMILDGAGNVYTSGNFAGTVDFNPGAGIFNLTAFGANDVYISKLDASGAFVWAGSLESGNNNHYKDLSAIAVDAGGNFYMAGVFSGARDLDPGSGSYMVTTSSENVYVTKLCQPTAPLTAILGNSMICSGSTNVYSVTPNPEANYYTWLLPGGWSGSSSTGTISLLANNANGIITVTADNCGSTSTKTLNIAVVVCTGIQQLSNQDADIKIFPNPNNGKVSIVLNAVSEHTGIEIYNLTGQLILSAKVKDQETNLDLEKLSNGIYILNVLDNEKVIAKQKLVKQ